MLSETDPAVMLTVAGPSHSMSTTPAAPGCRPWLQEVLEPPLPEPLAPAAGAPLAGAPVAVLAAGWLAATVPLLPEEPEEPHPAMVSTVAGRAAARVARRSLASPLVVMQTVAPSA